MELSVGIVGGGPRGLSALESLMARWSESKLSVLPHVHLFEPLRHPGAGQVYSLDQTLHNWLNVPERLLDLPARPAVELDGRTLLGFPSFWEFSDIDVEGWDPDVTDRYPTRAALGGYLHARFDSLAQALGEHQILTVHRDRVRGVEPGETGWRITTSTGEPVCVRELVLAAGHQPTELDEQMVQWLSHVERYPTLHCFSDAFPVERLAERVTENNVTSVALRGFGLSMIDVMKTLTEGLGGRYESKEDHPTALSYVASGAEPDSLIPFSLDGLPLGPKPLNARVDQAFTPTKEQLNQLDESLSPLLQPESDDMLKPVLIQVMSRITATVFLKLGERAREHEHSEEGLVELVENFLSDPDSVNDPLIDRSVPVRDALRGYIDMACDRLASSLDYCLGQVWRHAQPTLYRTLSYRLPRTSDQGDVVALDERMKRYAYGPPVASLERILALQDAGILVLDLLKDPDIQLSENGWTLSCGAVEKQAGMMVDTVLNSTTVSQVTSELFSTLLKRDILTPTDPELGVAIDINSTAKLASGELHAPEIAVLGRLAQGSLVGVDAILECFGDRQDRWADGVIERFSSVTSA